MPCVGGSEGVDQGVGGEQGRVWADAGGVAQDVDDAGEGKGQPLGGVVLALQF